MTFALEYIYVEMYRVSTDGDDASLKKNTQKPQILRYIYRPFQNAGRPGRVARGSLAARLGSTKLCSGRALSGETRAQTRRVLRALSASKIFEKIWWEFTYMSFGNFTFERAWSLCKEWRGLISFSSMERVSCGRSLGKRQSPSFQIRVYGNEASPQLFQNY